MFEILEHLLYVRTFADFSTSKSPELAQIVFLNIFSVEGVVVPVKLGNGNTIQLMVKRRPTEPDMIQRYSHLVLELGLQFKSMLGLCNSRIETITGYQFTVPGHFGP